MDARFTYYIQPGSRRVTWTGKLTEDIIDDIKALLDNQGDGVWSDD